VILEREAPEGEAAFLLAHDTDGFNRWEGAQALARRAIRARLDGGSIEPAWVPSLAAALRDDTLDPAFRALLLALPAEDETAQGLWSEGTTPDPAAIHAAHEAVRDHLAQGLRALLPALHDGGQVPGPFSPDARSAGRRALGNAALALLVRAEGAARAEEQFARADNMTQSVAALSALLSVGAGERELAAFEARWRHERLVMDKWFALQVSLARPEAAAATAERLTGHPLFDWRNPNRFRSVLGALAGNFAGFHDPSGAGYRLLASWLIRLDGANPLTAARASAAFDALQRLDPGRRALMEAELRRIRGTPGLSRDLGEMVGRMLQ
jgi:aminopeptidase N